MIHNIFIMASDTSFNQIFLGSNAINIFVMILILAFIIKKAGTKDLLHTKRDEIIQEIERSEVAKAHAMNTLKGVKEKIQHTEEEITSILQKSEDSADLLAHEIVKDGQDQAKRILDYAKFNIENHREAVISSLEAYLTKEAINKAIHDAKKTIDNHQKEKSIDMFIDNLDVCLAGVDHGK